MREQFNEPDLFHACGYGVPDLEFARACAVDRATVIVKDGMPNSVLVERLRKTPDQARALPGLPSGALADSLAPVCL